MNIACLQTRLIPGTIARLRACLPNAVLQLTAHPGHFDFVSVSRDEVRRIVRGMIVDAGLHDVELNILAAAHEPSVIPALEANLAACSRTLVEIEQEFA